LPRFFNFWKIELCNEATTQADLLQFFGKSRILVASY